MFISVINQLDAQKFCFTISLFHASTCFQHMCSSSGGQNCITQPLVSSHLYRCDDTRGCVMQFWPPDAVVTVRYVYFMPLHVSSTYAHHQEVKIALHSLWYHHTYRCDDTRGCVTWCTKILFIKLVNYWDKHALCCYCNSQICFNLFDMLQ